MSNRDFAIDVAKYFMDFLETNFHKRRAPKRVVKSKTDKNLLVGVNLKRFPDFKSEILKLVNTNFESESFSIVKGKHTRKISVIILELVTKYCESLTDDQVEKVAKGLENRATDLVQEYSFNVDEAKNRVLELARSILCDEFVAPLVEKITVPLESKHSFEEDLLFGIEAELCSLFENAIEDKISEFVVSKIVGKEEVNLSIDSIITLTKVREDIKAYFESFNIDDLFFEISELLNNKQVIDKQELYLYLFDIRLDKSIYPLFYMPIEFVKETDRVVFKTDSSLYINKKAVEFFVQQINERQGKKGKIDSVLNRKLYLAEESNISSKLENICNDIINYSQMEGSFQVSRLMDQAFRNKEFGISNNCYISLFDKSDESLVNDYEELIELISNGGDVLGDKFSNLLEGFLKEEPKKITLEVESEWKGTDPAERLVTISPIPLNDEQNQIIRALKKNSKFITVEGPPGTGKSHTITALVFNAILEGKNVLVLSDKAEALDVVEDKITETLNGVRLNSDFQNPILRLGKSGNTYNKILTNTSIDKIKYHYQAVEKHKDVLEHQVSKLREGLEDKISDEITEYSNIKLPEVVELEKMEAGLRNKNLLVINDGELLDEDSDLISDLESLRSISADLNYIFNDDNSGLLNQIYQKSLKRPNETASFLQFKNLVQIIIDIKNSGLNVSNFLRVRGIKDEKSNELKSIVATLEDLGSGFFGFFMKGAELSKLQQRLSSSFECPDIVNLKKEVGTLKDTLVVMNLCLERFKTLDASSFSKDLWDLLYEIIEVDIESELSKVADIYNDLIEVEQFIEDYPETSILLGVKESFDVLSFNLGVLEEPEFDEVSHYYRLKEKISLSFNNIPQYDYVKSKKTLENLYTTQMTHILDGRVINFFEKHAATAKTLKSIIKSKKKFPKEEFKYLKEAFPCIISGIRDYAEYIPLSDELFEIVIIDEASQVSIAQALPALLRAKRVVVFGDKKQFSNIKSAQARSEINMHYIKSIKENYTKSGAIGQSELERLRKFDIKTSVLDFFDYIGNYSITLKKHFRGYKELISYSSKNFYLNGLQAIKIRGKAIDEILEFIEVEHDGKLDTVENTNSLEIEQVVKYIESKVDVDNPPSIGVITPHTNQQKLLFEALSKHPRYDDFTSQCKLKVMTFDTCQGEERDHIVYSMVAHPGSDKLNYIFIKDLKSIDVDEDSKIKAQRLNVGFSRAKEKMVFICSKKVEDYTGAIGEAIRHYRFVLDKSRALPTADDVDKNSPMEVKVLNWLQETSFFKSNIETIELKAQFKIGDYLKQLEPSYSHPKYVCDFLMLYKDEDTRIHKIIIEYDGFKEHFTDLKNVNEFNYEQYHSDEHVYREKILEGYGYKFLRINRFNSGKDPIETLDKRLRSLVKTSSGNTGSSFIAGIHNTIFELEQGNLKECLKCQKLLPLVDFYDSSLATGVGRNCKMCKSKKSSRKRDRLKSTVKSTTIKEEANTKLASNVKQKSNVPHNQTEAYWGGRYRDCLAFYEKNGKWPSGKSMDKDERSLYYWAKQQRRRAEKGSLNSTQMDLIKRVNSFLKK